MKDKDIAKKTDEMLRKYGCAFPSDNPKPLWGILVEEGFKLEDVSAVVNQFTKELMFDDGVDISMMAKAGLLLRPVMKFAVFTSPSNEKTPILGYRKDAFLDGHFNDRVTGCDPDYTLMPAHLSKPVFFFMDPSRDDGDITQVIPLNRHGEYLALVETEEGAVRFDVSNQPSHLVLPGKSFFGVASAEDVERAFISEDFMADLLEEKVDQPVSRPEF